jgi:hypothetical protein
MQFDTKIAVVIPIKGYDQPQTVWKPGRRGETSLPRQYADASVDAAAMKAVRDVAGGG